MRVVLDSCVIYSGLRSRLGGSYRILQLIPQKHFEVVVSVPLVLQYEDVLSRSEGMEHVSNGEVVEFLDGYIAQAQRTKVSFLWRPFLADGGDDLVLEAAVAGGAEAIVTFNLRDFGGIDKFGIRAITPKTFIQELAL